MYKCNPFSILQICHFPFLSRPCYLSAHQPYQNRSVRRLPNPSNTLIIKSSTKLAFSWLRFMKIPAAMFKNHLRIAWRNLIRDRQFTLLNVIGLSAGLACTLLILLWVQGEYKIDHFGATDSQILLCTMEYLKGCQKLDHQRRIGRPPERSAQGKPTADPLCSRCRSSRLVAVIYSFHRE